MNEETVKVVVGLVELVDAWMKGIIKDRGITWQEGEGPPAFEAGRAYLAKQEVGYVRWLMNTADPKSPGNGSPFQEWLKGKTIGAPQATKVHTVEGLRGLGMVGIYEDVSYGGGS